DLFRAIESSTLGIRFGSTIDVTAEATARSQQDATSLADVVKFLMNMVQLNANKGPIADLAKMLQGAQVSADANTVKLALSLAESDFENLVKLGRRVPR
ncbi:MAG: hypothetical protein ACRD8O_18750, partial [Bryobacteraceae bacterium]